MINIYDYPETKTKLDGMIRGFYRKNSNYFKKEAIDLEDFYQEVYLKLLKLKVYHEESLNSYIILSAYCHMKNMFKKAVRKYHELGKALVNADVKCFENIRDNIFVFEDAAREDCVYYVTSTILKEFPPIEAFILCDYYINESVAKETAATASDIFDTKITQRRVFYILDKHKEKVKKIAENSRKCGF